MQELPIINASANNNEPRMKKPDWLRVKLPIGHNYRHVRGLVVLPIANSVRWNNFVAVNLVTLFVVAFVAD